jgi:hypothetical protein
LLLLLLLDLLLQLLDPLLFRFLLLLLLALLLGLPLRCRLRRAGRRWLFAAPHHHLLSRLNRRVIAGPLLDRSARL